MFVTARSPNPKASLKSNSTSQEECSKHATSSPGTSNVKDGQVRKSAGEIELRISAKSPRSIATQLKSTERPTTSRQKESQLKPAEKLPRLSQRPASTSTTTNVDKTYSSRGKEAQVWHLKALKKMEESGNLRRDIKATVIEALENMARLVKEAEADKESSLSTRIEPTEDIIEIMKNDVGPAVATHAAQIEEHVKLLRENNVLLKGLKDEINNQKELLEKVSTATYASVTANQQTVKSDKTPKLKETLHSVVVTSKNDQDSGERVLEKIREAVDAKEGWIEVRNVRKAKDRKVIIGLSSKAERDKLKAKLLSVNDHLEVEEVRNRDPLLVLRGVLRMHSDEDIVKALRNQNRDLFHGVCEADNRAEVRYRRKARNPHTCHTVISVSPIIWQRAMLKKVVQIDLQPVRVDDQSPLVQCTRCLGYGHGKRFCTDPADLCSHCGGPHLKSECADFITGLPPKCKNCFNAKMNSTEHNAFDSSCPIRQKWDALARSTVAYC
ncbi:unnamed protein product [Chrysodeixis includens]|uniref:Gag-like protein n=1 Tax=Chrysodeixis includens TaxID=689277 RepID=A0A9N8L469_CHRIL|nr:unnamed protein product [Chrysodeixis includens]